MFFNRCSQNKSLFCGRGKLMPESIGILLQAEKHSEFSHMNIDECPYCHVRVAIRENGICPSCRGDIRQLESAHTVEAKIPDTTVEPHKPSATDSVTVVQPPPIIPPMSKATKVIFGCLGTSIVAFVLLIVSWDWIIGPALLDWYLDRVHTSIAEASGLNPDDFDFDDPAKAYYEMVEAINKRHEGDEPELLTKANVDLVKAGMPFDEAVRILGPNYRPTEKEIAKFRPDCDHYTWEAKYTMSQVTVLFKDGVVDTAGFPFWMPVPRDHGGHPAGHPRKRLARP